MDDFDGEIMEAPSSAEGGEPNRDPRPRRRSTVIMDNDEAKVLQMQHDIIEKCVTSRIFFAEVVLGISLETWQHNVLEALDNGSTRISIRSGNGVGKTCLVAIIGLHYLLFRDDVKIPVTAPASSQLRDGLIPEMNKWISELPDFLKHQVSATQDRIVRVDNPANNFISFRTARKETPEALAGIHATYVMCLVDEASGVPDIVYEYAQGTLSTPGAIFIMISNPTRLSGFFFNSHHRMKYKWTTFHVSSFDTSRVDYSFVSEIKETYGEQSNQYNVKVMGEFPTGEDESLISKELITSSFNRDIAGFGQRFWGVDCGRGGDLSTMVERHGPVVNWVMGQNYSDTMQTVGWIYEKWKTTSERERPDVLFVDSIGIGAGVADRLRELGLPAVDVNVSESSSMKMTYVRFRDEIWYTMKDWFETRAVSLKIDDVMMQDMIAGEISAPLAVFTSLGKNAVETKPQMKSRGIQSPNYADALAMTFAYQGAIAGGYKTQTSSWKKPLEYAGAPSVY